MSGKLIHVTLDCGSVGYTREKRQGAGAVQDAGANKCGLHVREASWSAVALYRSYGQMDTDR
jgi:hypothetical protein